MRLFLFFALLLLPAFAFAQATNTFTGLLAITSTWLASILRILMALAVVVFLWGLVKFIVKADDPSEHDSGKNLMIWGMIALFVMVGMWGIIGYVQRSLGITGNTQVVNAPTVNLIPAPPR